MTESSKYIKMPGKRRIVFSKNEALLFLPDIMDISTLTRPQLKYLHKHNTSYRSICVMSAVNSACEESLRRLSELPSLTWRQEQYREYLRESIAHNEEQAKQLFEDIKKLDTKLSKIADPLGTLALKLLQKRIDRYYLSRVEARRNASDTAASDDTNTGK